MKEKQLQISNKNGYFSKKFCEKLEFYTNGKVKFNIIGSDWIGLDWNALFHVDKIVEKNQINECIIQVLAHINRYV